MIKTANIDFKKRIRPLPFDVPLGAGSGAGVIFGVTGGGVTEAVLRYAYERLTGQELKR